MSTPREWRLQTFLAFLLVITLLVALGIINGVILLVRIPQIDRENYAIVQGEVQELVSRMELLMSALQTRIEPLGATLQTLAPQQLHSLLDAMVGDGTSFSALYIVAPNGTVAAMGAVKTAHEQHEEQVGGDLSANRLYRTVRESGKPVWSDRYLSLLSNDLIVGLAVPAGPYVIIGEVPPHYLLRALSVSRAFPDDAIWIIDQRGELVGDTDSPSQVGMINILGMPVIEKARRGDTLPNIFEYQGQSYYVAVEYSETLHWYFMVRRLAGFNDPRIQSNLMRTAISFVGALFVAMLLAPLWASRMARPVRDIIERVRQVAEGGSSEVWPRSSICEFNRLSTDLESMSSAILEREEKFLTIFNASPIAMMVCDADAGFILVDVNQAWVQQFRQTRDEVIGRDVLDIGLSLAKTDCTRLFRFTRSFESSCDVWLLRGDGRVLLCELSARQVEVGGHRLMIWVMDDVTEKRRIDREMRALNTQLEARVEQRTEELARANRDLSETLDHLRRAQRELVQAEKLAALGELVAGVAHELNTPIGNGLMAASTLRDKVREFRRAMQEGLRRSLLENFVTETETAADITTRNLHRAAELVTSFKQVAVDQTSSQRRIFDLKEVVNEILVTLHPMLKRTPHQIIAEIPEGLRLNSYPGPLEQILANLINNACLHAFDEGESGIIRIKANLADHHQVRLRVIDNGKGIPAGLLDRIFNPFVTTKMGRGGTGLGLHIAYNMVTNILGGTLLVYSEEGQGSEFEMLLPQEAPYVIAEDGINGLH